MIIAPSILVYQLPALGQGRGEGRQGGRADGAPLPEAPPVGFFGSYRDAADKMDPSKRWLLPSLILEGRVIQFSGQLSF